MKLRAALSLQSVDSLRKISAHIGSDPGNGSNKTILIDLLCTSLSSASKISSLLDALNREQRSFVVSLAGEGGELLSKEAISELGDGFVHRFQGFIVGLSELGLVFQDETTLGPSHPLVGIPDSLLKHIPVPQELVGRLRNVMRTVSTGLLRSFALEIGAEIPDPRRPFIVESLHEFLLDPARLKTYLNECSETRRAIFDLFIREESATQDTVNELLGEGASRELEDLLWKSPLFFLSEEKKNGKSTEIRLASDLRTAIQNIAETRGGQLESRPEEVLEGESTKPTTVQENTANVQQDLATLLGLIERKRPRLLKGGGIPKGDLREAGQYFRSETDPGYAEFLTLFAETNGMVYPEGRNWRLSKQAGRHLESSSKLLKSLLKFWRDAERWNEWSVDRSSAAVGARAQELKSLRSELVEGLKLCPDDTWISYPRFYQLLTRISKPFRQFSEDPATGRSLAAGGTTADELLRRILNGPLMWMGVIQLGNPASFHRPLHQSDKAVFQITPVGRLLLLGKPMKELDAFVQPTNRSARFILQPNFAVLSPPDLPYAHFLKLCSLADIKTIDVMTTFQITRESIQQAFMRDVSGRSIRKFLTTYSATGIPEMVDALIEECDSKYGEIEIRPVSGYLTVSNKGLLDELYAQKQVTAHLGPRLSDEIAVLRFNSRPEAVLKLLQKQGYMPSFVEENESTQEERHQVIFTSMELSDLVGFMESAVGMLAERSTGSTEEVSHLIQRLRRGLRQVPDDHRQNAADLYKGLFDYPFAKSVPDDGLQDLERYSGENPTSDAKAIRSLIGFGIDHNLCIEIGYGHEQEDHSNRRIVEPFSEDHAMLYAYCRERRGDRVFKLDKILFARLTSNRFQR